jgi:hypothetical protein
MQGRGLKPDFAARLKTNLAGCRWSVVGSSALDESFADRADKTAAARRSSFWQTKDNRVLSNKIGL